MEPSPTELLTGLLEQVQLLDHTLSLSQPSGLKTLRRGGLEVLRTLRSHHGRTVPQIAQMRRTSRQTIQITVNHLKKELLVEIAPNPAHRKSALVRITTLGETLLETVDQNERQYREAILKKIPPAELVATAATLRKIGEAWEVTPAAAELAETSRGNPSAPARASRRSPKSLRHVQARKEEPGELEEAALPVNLL